MCKSKIIYTIVSGDEMMTKFMQAAAVFEKGKVVGTKKTITFSLEEGTPATLERVRSTMKHSVDAFKQTGELLTFMHFECFINGEEVVYNDGTVTPYVDKEVRVISDGKNWG